MKIAVLDTVYQGYVDHLYRDGSLLEKSWDDQYRATVDGGFPTLSSWVEPLRSRGHEVADIWANHMPLQLRWCQDHGAKLENGPNNGPPSYKAIVAEQIRCFKPDVILSGNLYDFDSDFLNSLAGHYRMAVGQHAAPLPQTDFSKYDAIISSLPNQVEYFNQHGVPSYLVKLAFDRRLLPRLDASKKSHGLIFAGSISSDHKLRAEAIRSLGQIVPIEIFGTLPPDDHESSATQPWFQRLKQWLTGRAEPSKITLHAPLWGLEMYQMMSESRIVFNRHIDAAACYANNLRLYEVCGSGAMLLTDWKVNMDEIFSPGIECVTYRDTAECVDLAKFYLQNDEKRDKIAQAGHRRVIAEHTYEHRVDELLNIIGMHIG